MVANDVKVAVVDQNLVRGKFKFVIKCQGTIHKCHGKVRTSYEVYLSCLKLLPSLSLFMKERNNVCISVGFVFS